MVPGVVRAGFLVLALAAACGGHAAPPASPTRAAVPPRADEIEAATGTASPYLHAVGRDDPAGISLQPVRGVDDGAAPDGGSAPAAATPDAPLPDAPPATPDAAVAGPDGGP